MSALKAAQGAVRPSQRATHDALQLRVRVVASRDIAMPGVALSRCVCRAPHRHAQVGHPPVVAWRAGDDDLLLSIDELMSVAEAGRVGRTRARTAAMMGFS